MRVLPIIRANRYGHIDLTFFDKMDFISDVTILDDGGVLVISVWFQQIHDVLDDVVTEASEVWHILDHASSELEVLVTIQCNLGLEAQIHLWELTSQLFKTCSLNVCKRQEVTCSHSGGSLQIGYECDLAKVQSVLESCNAFFFDHELALIVWFIDRSGVRVEVLDFLEFGRAQKHLHISSRYEIHAVAKITLSDDLILR